MSQVSDWRPQIAATMADLWPDLPEGPLWIEAQVNQESGGNPSVSSPVGAVGLLQLMPETAQEMGLQVSTVLDERFDPEKNLRAGVGYLLRQWQHFPEIPDPLDRLYWSFAAYNAGRGYMNAALALARQDKEPQWSVWQVGRLYLCHSDLACQFAESEQEQIRAQIARNPRWYRQPWLYIQSIKAYHDAKIGTA